MTDEVRREIALFRYGILAPLISEAYDESNSIKQFLDNAAAKTYTNPRGEDTKISASTLERWYYDYQRNGFDGLIPKRRSDTGKPRKIDDDIINQIRFLKSEYPRIPATLIHQRLIDNGTIIKGEVSLSTVNRFVNKILDEEKHSNKQDIKRYERAHINEVWCGDTCYGPYLTIEGKKRRVYIMALIDDASRYIVGVDTVLNDDFINLMSTLKTAVIRHGKPRMLNFDNGSAYKNKQMELVAARVGITLHFCMPYTPISKAKIERWFKTLRDQWMSQLRLNEYNTLGELRKSLFEYVSKYNQTVHSSLNGLSPQERFFKESYTIKRLNEDQIEKAFLLEYERRVSADNVVVLDGIHYEVDYRYSKQKITLRYSPDLSKIYVVDKQTGNLVPIKILNKKENALIKREKVKLVGGVK